MARTIERAAEFLRTGARILERRRFSYLFESGPRQAVEDALRAYSNADGGFGHGLEPDLRGPESEPIPAWTALGLLDEIGRANRANVTPILRYLRRISSPAGGVPFVLHDASTYPHAPWWETRPGTQPPALNPTAGLCGLLFKNRVADPWLGKAKRWCWIALDKAPELGPYDARVVLHFLDHVPERSRAAETLERLRPSLLRSDLVDLTSAGKGELFRPLDFAPEPGRLSRDLFSEKMIERNLDAIERAQARDGGWDVTFPIWTPITRFEWRGIQTVEMLKVLRLNGRLG